MDELDIETAMPAVLRAFYALVQSDELLGPIFNVAAHDWDEHLDRIGDYWSSVMLGTGRYKGNLSRSTCRSLRRSTERVSRVCNDKRISTGSCRRGTPDTRRRGLPKVCDWQSNSRLPG